MYVKQDVETRAARNLHLYRFGLDDAAVFEALLERDLFDQEEPVCNPARVQDGRPGGFRGSSWEDQGGVGQTFRLQEPLSSRTWPKKA